jgi:glutamate/tyrosine decarboxylase-like PLP-dependent enzyme
VAVQRDVLQETAAYAAAFLDSLDQRPIFPQVGVEELRTALGGRLPERGMDPADVIAELTAAAEPGVVGIPSGRYFGFVIGGALPAALAADWLTSTWDQNAGLYVAGPSAAVVEEVCLDWLHELLGLPAGVSGAFVTGCQMAHVTALAAARYGVLRDAGWDVNRDGLAGAPRLRVLTGDLAHVTVVRALRLLGIGSDQIVTIPSDERARLRVDVLRETLQRDNGPTIVVAQAGEVNTGSFDPLDAVAGACEETGAWLHVDGAFGLWAAASSELRHLVAGSERADSWATDAHKWLNVPYDSGMAFCRHADAHRAAMAVQASYLVHADETGPRDQMDWTPEFSRRARGFSVYAAIRSLGRAGVAELVERCCAHARRFAAALSAAGADVLNDVVLNQVLVRFGDDDHTDAVLAAVQADGTAFMSGTTYRGVRAMRISVSNWQTSEADVDTAIETILRIARQDALVS